MNPFFIGTMLKLGGDGVNDYIDFMARCGMNCCQLCRVSGEYMDGGENNLKSRALLEKLEQSGIRPVSVFLFYRERSAGNGFVTPELRAERFAYAFRQDWKTYSCTFRVKKKGAFSPYFGVEKNGIWFDRFMLNRGPETLNWESGEGVMVSLEINSIPGKVELPENKIGITAQVQNYTGAAAGDGYRLSVMDHTGKETFSHTWESVRFDPSGNWKGTVDFQPRKNGWFRISLQKKGGKELCWDSVVVACPAAETAKDQVPFVGLCGADTFPESAKRVGVKYLQVKLSWDACEPKEGNYTFDYGKWYDYKKQGFRLQALVTTAPPKWAIAPEEWKEAKIRSIPSHRMLPDEKLLDTKWRAFLRAFLRQYGDLFDIWEVGGELDALIGLNPYYKSQEKNTMLHNFAMGNSADRVARQLDIAISEIRRLCPDRPISAIRPSDVDSRYAYSYSRAIRQRMKEHLDFFGIDCYPQPRWIGPGQPPTGTEQTLAVRFREAKNAMTGASAGNNLMISEYGYFIDHECVSDLQWLKIHANRLARSYLKAKTLGFQALHYYATNIPNLEGKRYHMGLWYQGKPLMAVAAMNTVGRVVENTARTKEIMVDENTGIAVFEKKDGSAIAALWCIQDDTSQKLLLKDDHFEFLDEMGNPAPLEKKGAKASLRITGMPVYLRRNQKDGNNFQHLVRNLEEVEFPETSPVDTAFRPAGEKSVKLWLRNRFSQKTLDCTLRWKEGGREHAKQLAIPADKSIAHTFTLAGDSLTCEVSFASNHAPLLLQYSCKDLFRIPFKGENVLAIDGRDHIHPVDHTTYSGQEDLSALLHVSHDGNYLFVTADVTDDCHFSGSPSHPWRGDSMQIAIDPHLEYPVRKNDLGQDDSLLTVALIQGKTVVKVHRGPNRTNLEKTIKAEVTRDETAKKTSYRISIPLALLSPELKAGRVFGFNCVFFDDDTGSGADYWLFLRQGLAGGVNPELFMKCLLNQENHNKTGDFR